MKSLALVRLRWALPGIFAGLKIAVPAALLGALASEWLGATSGLGVIMVDALGYLLGARLWACCLVCIVLTVAGYAVVDMIGRPINAWHEPSEREGE